MKRICSILLCILLIVSMTISVYAVSSVPESVMKATESVVRVLAEYADGYATGSGFVIKSDKEETLIATNYHVVEGKPYSISVWLGEEETVSATILAYTNQKDMCILKLAYPVSLKPLAFSERGAKQGEAVYAVGFPGAADYLSDKEAHTSADATITDGIVSAVREATVSSYGTPTKILQINAAINSGNSGGPLFNTSGEVVGINTYGINDSQGIFGAIDVSELKSFMGDHSILAPSKGSGFPWIVLITVCGIAIVITVVLILTMRKRKMKTPVKVEAKNISLREYMEAHPEGIGMNDAVAMLLPVALQLRDFHNNGRTHLQVSPNTISVGTNGAILADATSSESDRYASGYAAPEIYRGTSSGNLSDIYSFCAVLSYVASGKQPANSLSRTEAESEDNSVEQFDSTFTEVIKIGTALDSANRFASMQDVIIKLSPYNTRPFVNTVTAVNRSSPETIPPKKAKVSTKTFAIVVAAILVVALLGTYLGCYIGAKTNAKSGDFTTANGLLFAAPITKLHDAKLVAYVDAGQLMAERKYGEANAAFEKLSGYLNADEMAKESNYRHAVQYADANDFDNAISIMTALSKMNYKDSAEKLLEIQYRNGVYLLQEKGDFKAASKIFSQLSKAGYDGAEEMENETQYLWAFDLVEKEFYTDAYRKFASIRDYADVEDCLDALSEWMYLEGQTLYYAESFSEAKELFECISSYADSKKYITLIDARGYSAWTDPEGTAEKLVDIFYFEDAAELLVSDTDIACYFLLGNWRTSNGSYYFKMELSDDDEYSFWSSYNLPWYGGSFIIEDGIYSVSNDSYEDKPQYMFTLLTPDSMEVYCYKNGTTYTLYR